MVYVSRRAKAGEDIKIFSTDSRRKYDGSKYIGKRYVVTNTDPIDDFFTDKDAIIVRTQNDIKRFYDSEYMVLCERSLA